MKGKKKSTGGNKKGAGKKSTSAKPSFLKRLLGRDDEGGKKKMRTGSSSSPAAKKKPLSPLERSIAEIRQLQKVGERDPERLALLLANILGKEKQQQQQAQEKFDSMVWDIVNRQESGGEDADGDVDQAHAAADFADTDGEAPPPAAAS